MTLSDLRLFVAAAQPGSLVVAAEACHVTPSAVSRAIQRLEGELRTALFDRVGKGLTLNDAGARLRLRALDVLALTEQTRAEFAGAGYRVYCRVAAPPLLQRLYGATLAATLTDRYGDSSITFESAFEAQAAAAVAQGTADFALVTDEAMREASFTLNHGLEAVPLGKITMHLAMSPTHALAQGCQRSAPILTAALSRFDFASPTRSMFCGRKRGIGSDDWRDEELPRRIRYWVDDLQVLIELVQSGRALAYLPDQLLAATGLKRVIVSDSPFRCEEQVFLLWRPARADGWQRTIVDSLEVAADAAGLPRSATSNTATRSVSAIRTSPTEHA